MDGWQWTPDLIWYDNLRSYGTPDYYVQKLFSNNKGSTEVPALRDGRPLEGRDSLYASACIDASTHDLILKLVNGGAAPMTPHIRVEGTTLRAAKAELTTLSSGHGMGGLNSLDDPFAISPVAVSAGGVKSNGLSLDLAPYSFTIVRLGTKP